MKKRIENIKKQSIEESKKILFVVLGFATGTAIAKGAKFIGEKYPQMQPYVQYATPILLAGGGWLISAATEKEEMELKHLGYGLTTSGVYEGVKLVPVVKDFLSGLEGNLGRTYYMENDKPILELGEFGINSLPMKTMDMADAPMVKIELPELEGANTLSYNASIIDLGYSSSITDDTDLSGII
ncbi:MAG: hypothetical protein H0U95_13280 [Bacteroidetes bacterium]|nr:hypothetical protein [Bacteroidota bacterium]